MLLMIKKEHIILLITKVRIIKVRIIKVRIIKFRIIQVRIIKVNGEKILIIV